MYYCIKYLPNCLTEDFINCKSRLLINNNNLNPESSSSTDVLSLPRAFSLDKETKIDQSHSQKSIPSLTTWE